MPVVDPEATALTTVERVLAHMREPSDIDGEQVDTLQMLVNAYSKAAIRYTRRQFIREDAAEKIFAYDGNGFLSLAPYEVRTFTTITLYTDLPTSAWQVLANQTSTQEAQWRPGPRNRTPEGTYVRLTLQEIGQFHQLVPEPIINRRRRGHEVTVLADWGMAAIPSDVALAVQIAVANGYRNPEAFAARQMGPLSFTEGVSDGLPGDDEGLSLPRDARALLSPYRRRAFA